MSLSPTARILLGFQLRLEYCIFINSKCCVFKRFSECWTSRIVLRNVAPHVKNPLRFLWGSESHCIPHSLFSASAELLSVMMILRSLGQPRRRARLHSSKSKEAYPPTHSHTRPRTHSRSLWTYQVTKTSSAAQSESSLLRYKGLFEAHSRLSRNRKH